MSAATANCLVAIIASLPPGCLSLGGGGAALESAMSASELSDRARQLRVLATYEPLVAALLDCTPIAPDCIAIVASYAPFVWVSPLLGSARRVDSRSFLTFGGGADALQRVLGQDWCVRQIIGCGGTQRNSVRFVYGPHASLDATVIPAEVDLSEMDGFITSRDPHDDDDDDRAPAAAEVKHTSMRLLKDEFIQRASFPYGLVLTTNLGRTFRVYGRSDHHAKYEVRAPPGTALVGIDGLSRGHMQAISCIFASTNSNQCEEDDGALDDAMVGGWL